MKNTWNKDIKKELKIALKGFSLDFGDGYLNIARKDGVHCEFYPNDETQEIVYLTATYIINNKIKEIDVCIPEETDLFVDYVKKILVA